MQFMNTFLCGPVDSIFTPRVLDAALGPNKLGKEAWINNVVKEKCGFNKCDKTKHLFKPIGLTDQQKRPLEFLAELQRDFMGTPKGTVVRVKLDVFNETFIITITLGHGVRVPVDLLIGPDCK